MSLFQSNLRKQIRNLPKILNFVKIIHYFSKRFTGVLRGQAGRSHSDYMGAKSAKLAEQYNEAPESQLFAGLTCAWLLFFSLPPSPGEGPLTATKTSAPRRGRTTGRRWVSIRVSIRVLSRHPLKFMEICEFDGFP